MNLIKYNTIYLDGIDKTGKDLIANYIVHLSNGKYIVNSRGIISLIAYSKLYNRNYNYELSNEVNNINVYLKVDYDDWYIRCKINNEPFIDYDKNISIFNETFKELKNNKNMKLLQFNTSDNTPYKIAKKIVNYINKLNKEIQNDR